MDQFVYEFSGFRLDVAQRLLIRNGEVILLPRKAIDVLIFLVQNRGRLLEKDYSMKALWPDSFVEESNLSHNIFVLRKVLGDDQNGNTFIQTIPRRGYRFVAEVKEVSASPPDADQTTDQADNASEDQNLAAKEYWTRNSPFRSLRAFEPEDSWLFFGRESEIEDLLSRLSKSPVLAVVGNSGSGKSSLIRAGLIPAVQQGRLGGQSSSAASWSIVLCRPSSTPFDYLSEILPGALAPELSIKEQADFIAYCKEKLPAGETALRNVISAIVFASAGKSESRRILLVVDQFEELFTLSSNPETRKRYIDSLLMARSLDGAVPVHVVLILRADFYANCLDHPELSKTLETNLYNLPRMSHAQLRENIEKRLTLARGQAEPGLIDSLLSDVGTEPGNLALLEHALGQLWEKWGGFGCTFTNQAYSEIGRLRGALGRHADDIYAMLPNQKQKHLAVKIFLELIQLGEDSLDTRRRIKKTYLLSLGVAQEVEQLLEILISGRLISSSREEQEIYIEISHEALIREWTTLRQWLVQSRDELWYGRRLFQAAVEWERLRRDSGSLLQGTPLATAEDWLTKHPGSPLLIKEFLAASFKREMEIAERRNREAVRLGKWVFGLLLAVTMISAIISLVLYLGLGLAT